MRYKQTLKNCWQAVVEQIPSMASGCQAVSCHQPFVNTFFNGSISKREKSNVQTNLSFVFRVWNIALNLLFFCNPELKLKDYAQRACMEVVPAKVFKSDFSLLGCAATPRKCSHHVGEEITSMIGGNWEGRKTKNRLFLLDFPFLWGFGIDPEWE